MSAPRPKVTDLELRRLFEDWWPGERFVADKGSAWEGFRVAYELGRMHERRAALSRAGVSEIDFARAAWDAAFAAGEESMSGESWRRAQDAWRARYDEGFAAGQAELSEALGNLLLGLDSHLDWKDRPGEGPATLKLQHLAECWDCVDRMHVARGALSTGGKPE